VSAAARDRSSRSALVALAVTAALVIAGFLLRKPLAVWFMGAPAAPAPTAAGPSGAASNPKAAYPPIALDALRNALDAADRIRALLARDQLTRVSDEARTLAEALRAASPALAPSSAQAAGHATAAATASDRLAAAHSLDDARNAFAELSEQLIALTAGDARLQNGLFVYECTMFAHGAKWIQRTPAIDNPYMGTRMPACGTAIGWQPEAQAEDAAAIDHYTCSMHPSVHASAPGTCPICGMTLVPVTKAQQREGVVTISPARQQLIGVRTSPVVQAEMVQSISAVGRLTYDESSLVDVNLKVRGWIVKLLVSKTGQRVQKGQALFTFYSPELQTAQQDLLLALRSQPLLQGAKTDPGSLARAARQRLRLLDLTDAQIDSIASAGEPLAQLTFTAPASGFVIEKDVVEGSAVEPGMRLFRIASLSKVWIEADVYEGDFPRLHVGQTATVALDYLPGRSYEATLAYVYPALDPQTRKGRVRLELRNQNLELRPGMFATVQLQSDLGSRLQVPASSVIYTGPRRLVFVDLGEGRFRPQEVQIGAEANGMYEVLSGLSAGDRVATSGVFLIAAEARISTAAKYWEGAESGELTR
jgi:Cu(I)/Ag(I) efflux system membrane fusion protein